MDMNKKKYIKPAQTGIVHVSLDALVPEIKDLLASGKRVTIYPRGTSMLPTLIEGRDVVTIAPCVRPLRRFEIAFFERTGGTFVLHRVVKTGKTYTFLGDAQTAFEKGIEKRQIIAVVDEVIRDGRPRTFGVISLLCVRLHYYRVAIIDFARRAWRKFCCILRKVKKHG